jgi:integrase
VRGSLKQRYAGSWSLILDLGYQPDSATGIPKRKQKWITFRGSKRQAQAKLAELVNAHNNGDLVEPSKLTLGAWLTEWLEKAIKPRKRAGTYRVYARVITSKLVPALGAIRLQQLKSLDIEAYYATQTVSASTLSQHHAILSGALKAAMKAGLVTRNVATLVNGKPQPTRDHERLALACWDLHEARTFLTAAKAAGQQPAAFYALALDAGPRKNELCGLRWSDLDLDAGTATFMRQLVKNGRAPEFGPVKNGVPRTVDLSAETVELLKAHRRHQAELKMRNRTSYHDLGLVFAKEWGDLHGREDSLGLPIQSNNLGQREFARIIKTANVRAITIHGLRHTCATLLLKAGVPAHVVQRRLGHQKIAITLDIYAHVLPSMQQDAAQRLGALLHG